MGKQLELGVIKTADGKYCWQAKTRKGEVVATSMHYTTKPNATRAMHSVGMAIYEQASAELDAKISKLTETTSAKADDYNTGVLGFNEHEPIITIEPEHDGLVSKVIRSIKNAIKATQKRL